MVDEMLAARLGGFGDRVLGLALGADEQHLAAAGDGLLDEVERAREQRDGPATKSMMCTPLRSPKMYGLHLGSSGGFGGRMRSGLEQLLHRDDSSRHWSSPFRFNLGGPCHQPFGRHRDVMLHLWDAAPPT